MLFRRRKAKVFGFGLSKTGTTTLKLCLREIGYRHSSYDPALLEAWSRGQLDEIWRTIERHDSFEDWPYPLMSSEIMERFGRDAYYILTVRKDASTWLESLKKHAMRQPPERAELRRIAYGLDYPHLDEAAMIARYEGHNATVQEVARRLGLASRLRVFCWEHGDGWQELCEFLGKSIPHKPFPHGNRAIAPDAEVLAGNQRRLTLLAAKQAETVTAQPQR